MGEPNFSYVSMKAAWDPAEAQNLSCFSTKISEKMKNFKILKFSHKLDLSPTKE